MRSEVIVRLRTKIERFSRGLLLAAGIPEDVGRGDISACPLFNFQGAVGWNPVFHPQTNSLTRNVELRGDVGVTAELLT